MMDFRFDVNYTMQDLVVANRAQAKKYLPVLILLSRSFFLVTGLYFVAIGIYILAFYDGDLFTGLLCLLTGLLSISLCFFFFQCCAWVSSRMLIKNTKQSVVTFEEEGFRVKSLEVEYYYRYSGLIACCYYEGRYLLFQDKKHMSVLPESALTAGDPPQFRDFIQQKTGKLIEYVK